MAKDKKPVVKKPTAKKKPARKARGLGRGLSALMSDVSALEVAVEAPAEEKAPEKKATKKTVRPANKKAGQKQSESSGKGVAMIAIDRLERNPDQPRRYFDPKQLDELTQSIADKGVLQPILVRPIPPRGGEANSKPLFQIVAGERRYQASLKAKLDSMPVLIRELSDQDVLEIGVVENVQRANLNPVEEAQAYRALIDQFGRTQEDIARAIGKSRPHIANMLRLLTLPSRAQEALKTGEISTGHARAIVAAPDPNALVNHIIDKGLSVRDAERWVRQIKTENETAKRLAELSPTPGGIEVKSADIRKVESSLREALGLKCTLNHKGPDGELRIKYSDDMQLDMILQRLMAQ